MKYLLSIVALMLFASGVAAQHKVRVISEDRLSETVGDSLKARIGSTSRYSLIENIDSREEINVGVNCLPIETRSVKALVCAVTIYVFPADLRGLVSPLNSGIYMAPTSAELAEDAFEGFVRYTTDEQLRDATQRLRNAANWSCGKAAQ